MDLQPNKIDGIYLPITNTRISASEWNQLVGSCMAFITEAGLTPDAADNEQFLNAFKQIAADLELVGANTNLSNVTNTGKSTSAGWAMPSATDISLTVGASGATYTAPANGYVYIEGNRTADFGYYKVSQNSHTLVMDSRLSNYTSGTFVPVLKGSFTVEYVSLTISNLKFIYAEGSKSEAQ